uniref:Proline and glutamate rich with coiled coil 1 n=1 Tax=Leptobrachium leishanense TaxID=445787 RepID=A0A8C5QMP3_9ANUR
MATGVIRNLAEFKVPSTFQLPLLHSSLHHDVDFQDTSEEEDDDMLEEEMEELADESPELFLSRDVDDHNIAPEDNDTEMTLQLLKFSELISSDIQRYFGQKTKEEDPDSCNIYEDYYVPRLSGQEMYYQDLVRMAQSRHGDKEDAFDPLTPPVELNQKILRTISRKEDPKKLGPLTELFDFGLRKFMRQKASTNKDGREQRLNKKYAHIVPMHRRMLPTSFWKEPSPAPMCILNTNTPDFSDLLENWTSDTSHELHNASRDMMGEFGR